jgi:hypothetical protein
MIAFIPSQYRNRKAGLVFAAVMAGLLVCGFLLFSLYSRMQVRLAVQEQQLLVSQKSVAGLENLKQHLNLQKQQIHRVERSLFKGKSQDIIVSTMQVQVQSMLSASGLEPELLRPVVPRETGNKIQSVVLKLRLNGTLEQLKMFLTLLYQADSFFHIENLTIRAFRGDQLRFYMDLRGYYQLSSSLNIPFLKDIMPKQMGGK